MIKRVQAVFVAATVMAAMLAIPDVGSACETIHLKRFKGDPPIDTGAGLCWTGCPFKFEGELDPGKGRWIFNKFNGNNLIDAVWTVEKNCRTGEIFYMVTERSDRFCADHPKVTEAKAAGAINMMMMFCPQSKGDYLIKGVNPKVCIDQTLNCPPAQQKAAVLLHDWDDVDDLGRGLNVTLPIPGAPPPGTVTFTKSKGDDLSVWFEFCCGDIDDYGQPGDQFVLHTYYVVRPPGAVLQSDCIYQAMAKGKRSSGDPLPDPNSTAECKEIPDTPVPMCP